MTYVLGLTGSVATGKSTVAKMFTEMNFPLIDCDVIAREVVEPGTPGLAKITENFGVEILTTDGALNRSKLGGIVFQDAAKRTLLNQILDAEIRGSFVAQLTALKEKKLPLIIADVPLLFESDYQKYVDGTMVVYVPQEIQCQRLMERNHYSEAEALQRITSQMPIEEKKKLADFVIDNSGSVADTQMQVVTWLRERQFVR